MYSHNLRNGISENLKKKRIENWIKETTLTDLQWSTVSLECVLQYLLLLGSLCWSHQQRHPPKQLSLLKLLILHLHHPPRFQLASVI